MRGSLTSPWRSRSYHHSQRTQDWGRGLSIDRFLGALVIKGEQEASTNLLETALQSAHLAVPEAARIEVLQLLKKGHAGALGVSDEPGCDLLPEPLKGN